MIGLQVWLPALATIALLPQAAAIRGPPPNRTFRLAWTGASLLVVVGFDLTQSYAGRRMGQPDMDQTVQMPLLVVGTGPAVSFEEYSAAEAR